MPCNCSKNKVVKQFVWTSDDGTDEVVYNTELEAKAKVMRKGGSYTQA